MIEARRRGSAARGEEEVRASSPCHFGRNPRSGGSLARERNMMARVDFVGAESVVREVIFCDERFNVRKDSIITDVVRT